MPPEVASVLGVRGPFKDPGVCKDVLCSAVPGN